MMFNHREYLNYELPNNWCAEENEDCLLLYNPDGNGAITVSFFNMLNASKSVDEQVSILAKKFVDQNNIVLQSPLILTEKKGKTTLYGTGITLDGWFIKIWVVAKHPKIAFATYQSEQKNKEVKICDSIIDSIQFMY